MIPFDGLIRIRPARVRDWIRVDGLKAPAQCLFGCNLSLGQGHKIVAKEGTAQESSGRLDEIIRFDWIGFGVIDSKLDIILYWNQVQWISL